MYNFKNYREAIKGIKDFYYEEAKLNYLDNVLDEIENRFIDIENALDDDCNTEYAYELLQEISECFQNNN